MSKFKTSLIEFIKIVGCPSKIKNIDNYQESRAVIIGEKLGIPPEEIYETNIVYYWLGEDLYLIRTLDDVKYLLVSPLSYPDEYFVLYIGDVTWERINTKDKLKKEESERD